MMKCSVCGNVENNKSHSIREMQYGTRLVFSYQQCGRCEYLEISEVPKNLGDFYPTDYYSFRKSNPFVTKLKSIRSAQAFGKKSLLGYFLAKKFSDPPVMTWIKPILKDLAGKRFLDVGCGAGIALQDLESSDLATLHGIDPFLPADRTIGRVSIRKLSLSELKEKYDFIMLNHSFEHMPNQVNVLKDLERILQPSGTIILRIPVIGNCWKIFGTDWYGADAPRHLSTHSVASFKMLLESTPFKIQSMVFDGTVHDYLASMQYAKDIPFESPRSYIRDRKNSIFSESEIQEAQRKADKANAEGVGDQATFYLNFK